MFFDRIPNVTFCGASKLSAACSSSGIGCIYCAASNYNSSEMTVAYPIETMSVAALRNAQIDHRRRPKHFECPFSIAASGVYGFKCPLLFIQERMASS
jgi:hypothetical protein